MAAEVFVALLDHLYTDSTEVAAEMALPLFAAADRFGVERLKLHCASRLESGLSIEDACAVLTAADRHQAHELREQCVAFIVTHFREVHTTEGFRELPRELLQVVHSAISTRLCPSGAQSGPPPSTRTSQRRHVASREHDKIEWAFGWIFTDVTSDQCPANIRKGRVRSVEKRRQVRSAPPVAKIRPPPKESDDEGEWTDQQASACAA